MKKIHDFTIFFQSKSLGFRPVKSVHFFETEGKKFSKGMLKNNIKLLTENIKKAAQKSATLLYIIW